MDFEPYNVNTVEENASDYLDKVNNLLAQKGVTDKEGNPAKLNALAGSPTWLFCLANGQNITEWQERLRKAYYSLDIEKCDDEQVYALATLAGVLMQEQSAPMIALTITNPTDSTLVLDSTNCYAEDSFGQNKWYVGMAYTLTANEERTIMFYCEDKQGSVPTNTSFTVKSSVGQFSDITVVSNSASVILVEGETTADLRNRILLGSQSFDQITQAQNAIKNLNGIVKCSIYFNPSANSSVQLPGNITLPPRTSFISIQGVDIDDLLATTYFKYVNVQSLEITGSLASETLIGASIVYAYYYPATEVHPKIKIHIIPNASSTDTYPSHIKEILLQHTYDMQIGETITAQKIGTWIDQGNKYGTIVTVELSSDGTTWSDMYTPSAFEVPVLQAEDISFEEVSL